VRLSLNLGYDHSGAGRLACLLAQEAEKLDYSAVWAVEAHGSDGVSVLSWIAAQTSRIDVGSAVLQIPARAPAMTAMTAATLDVLSDGRFRLGLGVSGPRVSQGWYGVPFDRPLARTREYVDIVRQVLSRQPVYHDGEHYSLGADVALSLNLRAQRKKIPLYLAAMGPKNVELAGEIADGWLAVFLALDEVPRWVARVRTGREKAGLSMAGFDVVPVMPLVVGADWRACAELVRPFVVRFVGAMGTRSTNFYRDRAADLGFATEASAAGERLAAHDYDGALAALPDRFLDEVCLLGPRERVAERMRGFAEAGVTTLAITLPGQPRDQAMEQLQLAAQALDLAGVGD
jgi:F420-dependent oxidoreductase-like protein